MRPIVDGGEELNIGEYHKIITDPRSNRLELSQAWRGIARALHTAIHGAAIAADRAGNGQVASVEFCALPENDENVYIGKVCHPDSRCRLGEGLLGMVCLAHIQPSARAKQDRIDAEVKEAARILARYLRVPEPEAEFLSNIG